MKGPGPAALYDGSRPTFHHMHIKLIGREYDAVCGEVLQPREAVINVPVVLAVYPHQQTYSTELGP